MKRNTLIAVVLCLMMITTAGAGDKSAKQDENPRQAGKSPIYFYDVEATDTHGFGQLVIDVKKHTFVFIGKDFPPSLQIGLQARQDESEDYVIFGSGKTTPSGNLHILGTWEANTHPASVVSSFWPLYPTYGFRLYNEGWFVAKIACYYSTDNGVTWTESGHTGDITIDHEKFVALKDLGVPDGALVKIHVIVVAGKDRTGDQVWQCYHSADEYLDVYCYEHYYIYGTTGNPTLNWDGGRCEDSPVE